MFEIHFTEEATNDLLAIAAYGIERFGVEQAKTYYDQLIESIHNCAEHPERFRRVDHIRSGYRRCVSGVHSIYFRQANGAIEIVRILGRQDPAFHS